MAREVELTDLLTHLASVLVEAAETNEGLVRTTVRTAAPVACPGCGQSSDWGHSRYIGRIADKAIGGRPVPIELSVRRLHCESPNCAKAAFASRLMG